jgi:K+-transporting ATPase KdpF subunit
MENVRMSVDNLLGGLVALALLAYLVYALIRPEKF